MNNDNINHRTGKPYVFSEESRKKMSEAMKGKPKSESHKAKLKARTIPPEVRAKISTAMKGHPVSAETRAKIAAAKLGIKRPEWVIIKMKQTIQLKKQNNK